MRRIWSAVSWLRLLGVAVLLPLGLAALQASTNIVKDIDIVVRNKPGGAVVTHQATNSSGTFHFENLPPGAYTIEAQLSATPGQQQTTYSSHTTITFTAVSPSAVNARAKAVPFTVSGPHVANGTLRLTGALKPGVIFSEDFTLSAPGTLSGTISVEAFHCPKGQVLRDGKCVSGDIPNNVTGEALTTDPVHCPPRTVLIDGKCVNPKQLQSTAVNTSRSNIKNNFDPGPLSINRVTCGTNSVFVTTNYVAPAGSTWVFTNANTRKATLFPPNQAVQGANGQLQFALDASNASYRVVIENSQGSSILPKPYLFTCGPSGSAAGPGSPAH